MNAISVFLLLFLASCTSVVLAVCLTAPELEMEENDG